MPPFVPPVGPVLGLFKSVYFVYVSPLFLAVVWAVMEKKKGLLPLIFPLIFPRSFGWPMSHLRGLFSRLPSVRVFSCFSLLQAKEKISRFRAFRWWPSGGRALGPSGGFWAPLVVLSGVLSGVWFLFRFPSLEAWFSFGLFRAFDRAKIPPTFHGFFHGKRQILGPEKQSQKQSQKDEKRGFLCAILCARKPPSSPWSGVSSRR